MTTTDTTQAKLIDCPAHPGKHWAVLDVEPMPTAGIWECPKGDSDEHDHYQAADEGRAEIEVEDIEVDTMRNGEHDTYPAQIYVCAGAEGCGVTLEGDPAADAAEDRADMAYDEWKDNQL